MQDANVKSFRRQDTRAEEQLAYYMDKYFYDKLGTEYRRIKEPELQLKGVDVVIGPEQVRIDEKASLYYSNVMNI